MRQIFDHPIAMTSITESSYFLYWFVGIKALQQLAVNHLFEVNVIASQGSQNAIFKPKA